MSESEDMTALTTMLALLPQIAVPGRREEAMAAFAALAASPAEPGQADLEVAIQRITPEDRALLREGLRVIEEWVREPGEETGARVDAVIERMRRELGPFIMRDREATVRDSIARRLRENRPNA
jgi:hypothetical protein